MGKNRLALVRDRGVSKVVAVTLMVAITVILGGLAGAAFLDLGGENPDPVPQATWNVEKYDTDGDGDIDTINITHKGGESFQAGTITAKVDGQTFTWNSEVTVEDTFVINETATPSSPTADETFPGNLNDKTLSLVYVSPDGDESEIILREEIG